jgi:hypothetical protein
VSPSGNVAAEEWREVAGDGEIRSKRPDGNKHSYSSATPDAKLTDRPCDASRPATRFSDTNRERGYGRDPPARNPLHSDASGSRNRPNDRNKRAKRSNHFDASGSVLPPARRLLFHPRPWKRRTAGSGIGVNGTGGTRFPTCTLESTAVVKIPQNLRWHHPQGRKRVIDYSYGTTPRDPHADQVPSVRGTPNQSFV